MAGRQRRAAAQSDRRRRRSVPTGAWDFGTGRQSSSRILTQQRATDISIAAVSQSTTAVSQSVPAVRTSIERVPTDNSSEEYETENSHLEMDVEMSVASNSQSPAHSIDTDHPLPANFLQRQAIDSSQSPTPAPRPFAPLPFVNPFHRQPIFASAEEEAQVIFRGEDMSTREARDAFHATIQSPETPEDIRVIYETILNNRVPSAEELAANKYWPFDGALDFMLCWLWCSRHLTRSEWTDIRKLLLALFDMGLINDELAPVKRREVRAYTTMRTRMKKLINVMPEPRQISVDYTVFEGEVLKTGEKKTGRKKAGKEVEKTAIVNWVPTAWHCVLGLLTDNGYTSLNRRMEDRADGRNWKTPTLEIRNFMDTPYLRRFTWLHTKPFVVVRHSGELLTLFQGHWYFDKNSERIVFVKKIEQKRHKKWLDRIKKGKVKPKESEKETWEWNEANRRPWIEVTVHYLQNCNHFVANDDWNQLGEMEFIYCTQPKVFRIGEKTNRTKKPRNLKSNKVFDDWIEVGDIEFPLAKIGFAKESFETEAVASVSQQLRADIQKHFKFISPFPVEFKNNDPYIMFTHGWDTFESTSFSRRTTSLTGFYSRLLNTNQKHLPWVINAVARKEVPAHKLVCEYWKDLAYWKEGWPALVHSKDDEGNDYLRRVQMKGAVGCIALDKAELDGFHGRKGSASDNRCESVWNRGGIEGLELPDDFQQMDYRYVALPQTLYNERRKLLENTVLSKTAKTELFKQHGFNDTLEALSLLPEADEIKTDDGTTKYELPFNNLIVAPPDLGHTLNGTLTRLMEMHKLALAKREDGVGVIQKGMEYIEELKSLNGNMTIIVDPLGKQKSDKTDHSKTMQRALWFTIAMNTVDAENPQSAVLRMAMQVVSELYSVSSLRDSHYLQSDVKILLAGIQKHYQEKGFESMANMPHIRAVLTASFYHLHEFRGTNLFETIGVEHTHTFPKTHVQRHWNWRSSNFKPIHERRSDEIAMEFILAGGVSGPNLSNKLSAEARNLPSPINPAESLFAIPSRLGFGSQPQVGCRVHALTVDLQKKVITTANSNSVMADIEILRALEKFLKTINYVAADWRLPSCFGPEATHDMYLIERAQINAWENSAEWTMDENTQEPEFQVRIQTPNGKYYLADIYVGVLFVDKTLPKPLDFSLPITRRQTIRTFYCQLYHLHLPTAEQETARQTMECTWNLGHSVDLIADKIEGKRWIPDWWLMAPALKVHNCHPTHCGRQRNAMTGEEVGPWKCDYVRAPVITILSPEFMYQPRLWQKVRQLNSYRMVYTAHEEDEILDL